MNFFKRLFGSRSHLTTPEKSASLQKQPKPSDGVNLQSQSEVALCNAVGCDQPKSTLSIFCEKHHKRNIFGETLKLKDAAQPSSLTRASSTTKATTPARPLPSAPSTIKRSSPVAQQAGTGKELRASQSPAAMNQGPTPHADPVVLDPLVKKLVSSSMPDFQAGIRESQTRAEAGDYAAIELIRGAIRIRSGRATVSFYEPRTVVSVGMDRYTGASQEIIALAKRQALLEDVEHSGELIAAFNAMYDSAEVLTLLRQIYGFGTEQGYAFELVFNELFYSAKFSSGAITRTVNLRNGTIAPKTGIYICHLCKTYGPSALETLSLSGVKQEPPDVSRMGFNAGDRIVGTCWRPHWTLANLAAGRLPDPLQVRGWTFEKEREAAQPSLLWAAFTGRNDVVKLLSDKTSVKATNNVGETPLHLAALGGHRDVAELLLANEADVSAKRDVPDFMHVLVGKQRGEMPLHVAARAGHKDIVQLLLAKAAQVNAQDNDGNTPLHSAAYSGRSDIVEILLGDHAEVNAKNNKGQTALQCALEKDSNVIAELLRQHGGH